MYLQMLTAPRPVLYCSNVLVDADCSKACFILYFVVMYLQMLTAPRPVLYCSNVLADADCSKAYFIM